MSSSFTSEAFRQHFKRLHQGARGTHPYPYYKLLDGVAIVGVDTTIEGGVGEGGCIDDEALAELDRILALASMRNRHVIVAMHHPPYKESGLAGAKDFWEVVDADRVDLIVCGHDHESYEAEKRGVSVCCVGGCMWDDGECLIVDARPNRALDWRWWSNW